MYYVKRGDNLGAVVLNALIERVGVALEEIDDIILGCVTPDRRAIDQRGTHLAFGCGWSQTIPGMTIDRKCGSFEAALHVAAGLIAADACRMGITSRKRARSSKSL